MTTYSNHHCQFLANRSHSWVHVAAWIKTRMHELRGPPVDATQTLRSSKTWLHMAIENGNFLPPMAIYGRMQQHGMISKTR
jgi:hypothetical protein